MGKIRTRVIGLEDVEQEQKEKQKAKSAEKKVAKKADKPVTEPEATVQEDVKTEKKAKKTVEAKSARPVGARHLKARAAVKPGTTYSLNDAIELLKKIKYAGFDESVELHINATVQGLRGEVELPYSTGKKVRVAIVSDALLSDIADGKLEFDVLIAHPSYMPKLAKYARILGPKGLMPNPKTGTISDKPEEVAKRFQGGLLKWKGEAKFPLIHQMIAKISQDSKEIEANADMFIKAVGHSNIKEVFIKTTMSPALKLSVT